MARITKSESSLIPNVELMMSGPLIKMLDQDEVSDRVHYAAELKAKAKAKAADDPTIRRAWELRAGAVLQMPRRREEIEKQVGDLRTKARLSWNAVAAAGLRDEADRVLDANPIAPRRQQALRKALRKAAGEGQIAVYDKDGNLVGTVAPEKVTRLIQPSAPAAKGDPAPAGQTELGTPKQPASAATPAANTPAADDVTKQRRTLGVYTRRL